VKKILLGYLHHYYPEVNDYEVGNFRVVDPAIEE